MKIPEILQNEIHLSETEWILLKSNFKEEKYPSKTIVVREGEIARNIYFIKSGLLRTYTLQEGKEVSTYFACEEQFISIYSSFISQKASLEFLEVVEDCILYSISYKALTKLYTESIKFEKLGRILAEKNYLCILDRTLVMQTKTAKDRYLDFVNNYHPLIVQRVPQHQIASFIGIAPESLSRIRKELSIS